jgi:predicted DNA-binding transcriptional regulator YafY
LTTSTGENVPVRADRLVATLLLMQARGKVTATEVAAELEVSVKTARRDLEALAMAGIPVYSQPGRNGGWSLIGGARTDLSGLTADEARTLFLVAGPSATVAPELKAALRKLVQALPETFRAEAEAAAGAVVFDPVSWGGQARREPEELEVLQRAVIDARQVELGYTDRSGAPSVRTVHPLGLVSKAGVWYLVAGTDQGQRTFRLSRITSVEVTDQPVRRPAGFELEAAWAEAVAGFELGAPEVEVAAVVPEEALGGLRMSFGRHLRIGDRGADGRYEITLAGYDAEDIARRIAGWAAFLDIDRRSPVAASLARIGSELRDAYG